MQWESYIHLWQIYSKEFISEVQSYLVSRYQQLIASKNEIIQEAF